MPNPIKRASTGISYETFAQSNGHQLSQMKLPLSLWSKIFNKLKPPTVRDAGDDFVLDKHGLDKKEKEGEDAEGLTESVRYYLHAKHDLIAEDNVWLIDHSFTCDGSESTVHQLFGMNDKDNKLLERLCYLVNVDFPINLILKNKVFDQEMANTISTVEKEAGVSYARAKLAVKRQEGDLVDAILECNEEKIENNGNYKEPTLSDIEDADLEGNNDDESDEDEGYTDGLAKKDVQGTYELFKQTLQEEREENVTDEEATALYRAFRRERGDSLTINYTDKYIWKQNLDDSSIEIMIPYAYDTSTLTKKDVSIKFTPTRLSVTIAGNTILQDVELQSRVDMDGCTWNLDNRNCCVVVSLEKTDESVTWDYLVQNEMLKSRKRAKCAVERQKRDTVLQCIRDIVESIKDSNLFYVISTLGTNGTHDLRKNFYVMDEIGSSIKVIYSNEQNLTSNVECHPFIDVNTGQVYSLMWVSKNMSANDLVCRTHLEYKQ